MNRKTNWILAAALAGGTLGPHAWAEDQPAAPAQPGSSSASFPAGIKLDDDNDDKGDVLKTLNSITEAALAKDGFDDVVERLGDQDRNRIGENGFSEQTFADLNAKVAQLRTAWQAKYGDDFEVEADDDADDADENAFKNVTVIEGEIEDPQAVASAWPVPAVTQAAGEAVPASAKQTQGNADPNLNSNIEKGRDVAIATIPASHGLPALNVSLIGEAQGWRIDVPNALTGQQLHDGLLKHLSHVADMQAQWPADKNEAAAMVAHHVLLAAYGVDVEPGQPDGQQQPSGDASTDLATDAPPATPPQQ